MNKLWLEIKTNLRLRMALAVIVAILGWNALLDARASLDTTRTAYRQAANQSARLANMKNWTVWPGRNKQSQALVQQLESRLWRYPTVGLAQASLQDWLMQSLVRQKVNQPAVALVEDGPADAGTPKKTSSGSSGLPKDVAVVRFKMDFTADGPTAQGVLAAWLDADRPWRVESLNLRRQPNGFKVESVVATSVLLQAEGAKP
jgi:hypothetical protein